MNRKLLFAVVMILALALVFTGCSSKVGFGNITVDQVQKVIEENPDLVLLDVRTQLEHDEDALEGSILIPIDEITARLSEIDKDTPYLLFCRSGIRSGQVYDYLKSEGYTKLFNMQGGMVEYRNKFPK